MHGRCVWVSTMVGLPNLTVGPHECLHNSCATYMCCVLLETTRFGSCPVALQVFIQNRKPSATLLHQGMWTLASTAHVRSQTQAQIFSTNACGLLPAQAKAQLLSSKACGLSSTTHVRSQTQAQLFSRNGIINISRATHVRLWTQRKLFLQKGVPEIFSTTHVKSET